MHSVRVLLHGIIDYAGLFPPAGLDMAPAVAEYAAQRAGPHHWVLGRFVSPAARLEELGRAADRCVAVSGEPWRVSALVGAELSGDLAAILRFNDAQRGRAVVDAVELKAATPAAIGLALDGAGTWLDSYIELPVHADPGPLIRAAAERGARVKIRTGGITADAFPTAAEILRFIRAAWDARVPFKATAGLHHPLCGSYPLTYAPDAERAPMYGFLNVFLAAAFIAHGASDADVHGVLTEGSAGAFRFTETALEWRGRALDAAELARARRELATSFGSCSFREPISDLESLGLL